MAGCSSASSGPPAAGKSTLAATLVEGADRRHGPGYRDRAADGRLPPRQRGAGGVGPPPAQGSARHLRRRRVRVAGRAGGAGARSAIVYAPRFDRSREEAIAGVIAIDRSVRLVVLEGNYLLRADGEWSRVGDCLDESWYLDTPVELCVERLLARQTATYGSAEAAADWVIRVDQPNAALVAATRQRADWIVDSQ